MNVNLDFEGFEWTNDISSYAKQLYEWVGEVRHMSTTKVNVASERLTNTFNANKYKWIAALTITFYCVHYQNYTPPMVWNTRPV